MSCYQRITLNTGAVVPCGRCTGCFLSRARSWSLRCMHELTLHKQASFLTLTYDDENLATNDGIYPSLQPADMTLFLKRLRKNLGKKHPRISYLYAGEYGELFGRPHYHMILFGSNFRDKSLVYQTRDKQIHANHTYPSTGSNLYSSTFLDFVWGKGQVSIGDVTPDTIAYTCQYTIKKQANSSRLKDTQYPEFIRASRNPAIGLGYIEQHHGSIFDRDKCTVNGQHYLPPRYYMDFLKSIDPVKHRTLVDLRQLEQQKRDEKNPSSNTTRKIIANSKVKKRKL